MRSATEYNSAFALHGPCQIDVPYKGVWGIFVDEVLSPFYIFQVASVVLWVIDEYYFYSASIFIMSFVSVLMEIAETRANILNVRAMSAYECPVNVLRWSDAGNPKEGAFYEPVGEEQKAVEDNAEFLEVSSTTLVPGDIIEIPQGKKMPCDCVLLSGGAIINEAMLTGESIPVLKTSLPFINDIYDPENDKKYTIYSGTDVIQVRPTGNARVCALVVKTGFTTVKGELVRSILYPKPSKFKFDSDSYKFLMVMLSFSVVGLIVQLLNPQNISTGRFIKKCLDLITITVPPSLPAAMTIGTSFALARLKKRQIFCISPPKVNMAGKISVFCFDKTGTLTEEGLSVYGFRVSAMTSEMESGFSKFYPRVKGFQPPKMYTDAETFEAYKDRSKTLMVEALASCHSITRVDGELIGDPLDIEMFNSTGWILDEPEVGGDDPNEMISAFVMPNEAQRNYDWTKNMEGELKPYQVGIVRRFDFTSKLQRMSVIVQNLRNSKYRLYTKGSPEKIMELSRPETIPGNFMEVLSKYTQKGCRVLALATRPLNINYLQCQKVGRELIEKKLIFLGFLIMQNKVKEVTPYVISTLEQADIRSVMVTGDNAYTAISVARECRMIPLHHRIYMCDLIEESRKKYLKWIPIEQLEEGDDDDPVPEEVRWNELGYDRKDPALEVSSAPEYIPQHISDSLAAQLEKTSQSIRKSQIASMARKKRTVLSDEDYVDEGRYPWDDVGEAYSLVFTGKSFDYLMKSDPTASQEKTKKLLRKSAVFARMSPDGKALLIDALQSQNQLVGMCGDGANDCVALKAADVGISLSEAEASIAAPFTSKTPDISCVIKLLREGRAALSTSFVCFKYMALYSMIQFTSATILYSMSINLTDWQFMYSDILIIFPIAVTMSWTKAASTLSKQQPLNTLICWTVLSSILGQITIVILFQVNLACCLDRALLYCLSAEMVCSPRIC
eukprot:TRINITY_DN15468_c0_g1_i13.p1 TRINITY_DN15468_c0_g1~~TRINITY_DN15468_c0_g1_i13.p1  ORF type:complete len:957 (-),score=308.46 TRINITY_DN15468_c0_g1_i13:525-3395(-)